MATLDELNVIVGAEIDEFTQAMKDLSTQANAAVQSIQTSFSGLDSIASSVTALGASLTAALTVPLAGIATAATVSFEDLQTALTQTGLITGATADQMTALTTAAETIGTTTQFSAGTAAAAMLILSQNAQSADDVLTEMQTVTNLAAAAHISLGQAAQDTASILKEFGLDASQASDAIDAITKASQLGGVSIGAMSQTMQQIAPLATAMGYSLTDVAAAMATMTSNGVPAGVAAQSLRMILSTLDQPSQTAAQRFSALGVSLHDSEGNARSLSDVFGQLSTSGAAASDMFDAFTRRSGAGAVVLMNNVSTLKDYNAAIQNAGGVTQAMADVMNNTLSAAFSQFTASLTSVMSVLGASFAPQLTTIVQILTNLVNTALMPAVQWFNNLSTPVKDVVLAFVALVAGLGPLLLALGGIGLAVTPIITGWTLLTGAFATFAATTIPGLLGALGALISTGLMAMGEAITALVTTAIPAMATALLDLATVEGPMLLTWLTTLVATTIPEAIAGFASLAADGIAAAALAVAAFATNTVPALVASLGEWLLALPGLIAGMGTLAAESLTTAVLATNAWLAALGPLVLIIGGAVIAFEAATNGLDALRSEFGMAADVVVNAFTPALIPLRFAIDAITSAFSSAGTAVTSVKGFFSDLADTISGKVSSGVKSAVQTMGDYTKSLVDVKSANSDASTSTNQIAQDFKALGLAQPSVQLGLMKSALADLKNQLDLGNISQSDYEAAVNKVNQAIVKATNVIDPLAKQFKALGIDDETFKVNELNTAYNTIVGTLGSSADAATKLAGAHLALADALEKIKEKSDPVILAFKDLGGSGTQDVTDKISNLNLAMGVVQTAFDNGKASAADLENAFLDLVDKAGKLATSVDPVGRAFSNLGIADTTAKIGLMNASLIVLAQNVGTIPDGMNKLAAAAQAVADASFAAQEKADPLEQSLSKLGVTSDAVAENSFAGLQFQASQVQSAFDAGKISADVYNQAMQDLQTATDALADKTTAATSIIKSLGGTTQDVADRQIDEMNTKLGNLKDQMDAGKISAGDFQNAVLNVQTASDKLNNSVNPLSVALNDLGVNKIATASAKAAQLKIDFDNLKASTDDSTQSQNLLAAAGLSLQKQLDQLSNSTSATQQAFADLGVKSSKSLSDLATEAKTAYDLISGDASSSTTDIQTAWVNMTKANQDAWTAANGKVNQSMADQVTYAQQQLELMKGNNITYTDDISKYSKDGLTSVGAAWLGLEQGVFGNMANMTKSVRDGMVAILGVHTDPKTGLPAIQDAWDAFGVSVATSMGQLSTSIADKLFTGKGSWVSIGEQAMNDLLAAFGKMAVQWVTQSTSLSTSVGGIFKGLFDKISGWFGGMFGSGGGATGVEGVIEGTGAGIEGATTQIGDDVGSLATGVSSATSGVTSLVSSLSDFGGIIGGAVSGLVSGAATLIAAHGEDKILENIQNDTTIMRNNMLNEIAAIHEVNTSVWATAENVIQYTLNQILAALKGNTPDTTTGSSTTPTLTVNVANFADLATPITTSLTAILNALQSGLAVTANPGTATSTTGMSVTVTNAADLTGPVTAMLGPMSDGIAELVTSALAESGAMTDQLGLLDQINATIASALSGTGGATIQDPGSSAPSQVLLLNPEVVVGPLTEALTALGGVVHDQQAETANVIAAVTALNGPLQAILSTLAGTVEPINALLPAVSQINQSLYDVTQNTLTPELEKIATAVADIGAPTVTATVNVLPSVSVSNIADLANPIVVAIMSVPERISALLGPLLKSVGEVAQGTTSAITDGVTKIIAAVGDVNTDLLGIESAVRAGVAQEPAPSQQQGASVPSGALLAAIQQAAMMIVEQLRAPILSVGDMISNTVSAVAMVTQGIRGDIGTMTTSLWTAVNAVGFDVQQVNQSVWDTAEYVTYPVLMGISTEILNLFGLIRNLTDLVGGHLDQIYTSIQDVVAPAAQALPMLQGAMTLLATLNGTALDMRAMTSAGLDRMDMVIDLLRQGNSRPGTVSITINGADPQTVLAALNAELQAAGYAIA